MEISKVQQIIYDSLLVKDITIEDIYDLVMAAFTELKKRFATSAVLARASGTYLIDLTAALQNKDYMECDDLHTWDDELHPDNGKFISFEYRVFHTMPDQDDLDAIARHVGAEAIMLVDSDGEELTDTYE